MPLTPGTHLGPYEIAAPLGAGGMGEVYRARDTKLGRDVAIKVLPATFSHDPERIARFQREAQLLASLNHPHIASIYGLEEANGTQFLVLELVDGETFAQKLGHGSGLSAKGSGLSESVVSLFSRTGTGLPVNEALAIARQIADALQAAHEKGIIHRDLKPANIIIQGAWGPTPTRWKTAASSVDSPPRVSDEIVVKVLKPHLRGRFSVPGTFVREHGGPIRVDEVLELPTLPRPRPPRARPWRPR